MRKIESLNKIKGGQSKRIFLICLFIAGLLFTGRSLLASGYSPPQQEESGSNLDPVLSLEKIDENVPFSQENENTTFQKNANDGRIVLRLDGIGGDDNGLGEEDVPIGDGFFILISLSALFIIYRLRKHPTVMRFLHNKRIHFIFLILATIPTYSFAIDYYWVGGNGNWSDISHWATTSGGTIKYTLPPTAADNVYFDAGSGFTSLSKTVTVNQSSFCNNMIWSGSAIPPTFTVSNNLQVNGSLKFQTGMTVNGATSSAAIIFVSSLPNQTITTGNNLINIPFTFNGTGGWVLQDSLKLLDGFNLSFTKGDLDFNGQYVKMGYFAGAATSGVLKIANSTIYVTGSWTHSTAGSAPLTAANSLNSQIFINLVSMTTKANDVYYNVTLANNNGNASLSGGGIFNCVTFLNGGTVQAATTDSLILQGAKVYNITNNNINVNKYLKANMPPCSGLIELTGTGTFKMSAGAVVDVVNARIKNITIQGPAAPYAASNSIDLGGNVGWAFSAPVGQTYYWVGGGGNWNDVSHWASSSGGAPGSGCVPIQLDNVIFDGNSGFGTTVPSKTVMLDGNAYCNNMTWSGAPNNPILATNNKILEINASLQLQPNMTTTGSSSSYINFTTTLSNQTITTAGVTISSNMTFNGTGGWNLQDSLKVPGYQVTFTDGNLNFNGQYAIMRNFSSSSGNNTRILNIANSTIDVGYPGQQNWIYTGGVALTADKTVNSEIRVITSSGIVTAKNNDVYYNVTFLDSYYFQTSIANGIYNKVSVLAGNGISINNITTDSLICKAIGKYQFASSTNTIKKYFKASPPPCSGLIELISNTTGSQRTIAMTAGSVVDVSNCRIQDIRITGATPYTASGSIDLGNNTGWVFTTPTAHTYYWVGGTGNWNDGNHWATTSGGTPGSGCIPTQYDNVIFDAGSGFTAGSKTVTVDGFAYCDSMTWSGIPVAPTFNVGQNLQVNGSMKLQTGMSVPMNWSIIFTSSRPNETISTGNVTFSGSGGITFNGTGGWQLQDSLKTTTSGPVVGLTQGNLDLNGQFLRISNFSSTTSTLRTLNIANSTIEVIGSNGLGKWEYTGTGSTPPISTNSLIRFTGSNTPTITTDAGDVYYNLEFLYSSISNTDVVNRGIYNK